MVEFLPSFFLILEVQESLLSCYAIIVRVLCMSSPNIVIRMSKEDRTLLENMAKYYGVTQSDIIRIALKEFAKSHGFNLVQQA